MQIEGQVASNPSGPSAEPTGWERVDRCIQKAKDLCGQAQSDIDFQQIGHACRESLVALADSIFIYEQHSSYLVPGDDPSKVKPRMKAYFASVFKGRDNKDFRKLANRALSLMEALIDYGNIAIDTSNKVQHGAGTSRIEAELSYEAARTAINIVRILEKANDNNV